MAQSGALAEDRRHLRALAVFVVWLYPIARLLEVERGAFDGYDMLVAAMVGAVVAAVLLLIELRHGPVESRTEVAAFVARAVTACLVAGLLEAVVTMTISFLTIASGALAIGAAICARLLDLRAALLAHHALVAQGENREFAPGQEPEGPQDAVPAKTATSSAFDMQRRKKRVLTSVGVIVIDVVIAVVTLVAFVVIGFRSFSGEADAATALGQEHDTLVLCACVCPALLVCAILAGRAGARVTTVLQCCFIVIVLVTGGMAVSSYHRAARDYSPQQQPWPTVTDTYRGCMTGSNDCPGG